MNSRNFLILYICSFATWFVGTSMMPILPLYAGELGAKPAMTGNLMAVSFFFLTLGTLSAGRLSQFFNRRRSLIIAAGIICVPATWQMGLVTHVWQLAALTVLVWFVAGVTIVLQSVILGFFASSGSRGRWFGILATTSALSGLVGRLLVGSLID